MENGYTEIDENKWRRTEHCRIFRDYVDPCYCITTELDITIFHKRNREQGHSFTLALIYAVSACANKIEEFRYRFVDGKIVLFDRINTALTHMKDETELFQVVNITMQDDLDKYLSVAAEKIQNQKVYFTGPLGNDIFMFSPLPWISYTHISHTNSGKKDNATPLFDWGKFFERDGKIILPFSVQVHHSFVDGIHVGKLISSLQNYLNDY
ncbi:MAG: chloramphenicol acetyltransferase [Bacteroidales bacterium]|jgi:chloramphenicol O-acetyltransferase type B|nr:chloramphenicol acetyltransferase [Bacteroidales bacterium]